MKFQSFIVYIITAICLLASPLHPVAQDSGIEKNKKWNDFLYDATGKTTKERKKDFGKVKKK